MITNFKLYESFNEGKPEIGDYIILYPRNNTVMMSFVDKIGKISDIFITSDKILKYSADFDENRLFNIELDRIDYWSKNKKELEEILDAKKYNL